MEISRLCVINVAMGMAPFISICCVHASERLHAAAYRGKKKS